MSPSQEEDAVTVIADVFLVDTVSFTIDYYLQLVLAFERSLALGNFLLRDYSGLFFQNA